VIRVMPVISMAKSCDVQVSTQFIGFEASIDPARLTFRVA